MAEEKPTKHTSRFKDLSGKQFGRLRAVAFHGMDRGHNHWVCECQCGVRPIVSTENLTSGRTRSCGCLRSQSSRERGYIGEHVSEHASWAAAKDRCFNPNNSSYQRYGGRGITMCDEWRASFVQFFADMGPRPDGMSLNRVDNDGPYAAWNCEWASDTTQSRNRRSNVYMTHDGETLTIAEWSERTGIPYQTLQARRLGRSAVPMFKKK